VSVLPFLYPPFVAVALAPLAALPYALAFLFWLALNCMLYFTVSYALERYAGLTGRRAFLVRLGSVCSLPVFMALGLGQVSILVGYRLAFVVPLQLSVLAMLALAVSLYLANSSRVSASGAQNRRALTKTTT